MVRFAALAAVLAACNDNTVDLHIVIDSPPADSPAAAFPDLDTVELSVALAGAPLPLTSKTFRRGDEIAIPDVPYGENLVVHMIGRVGNSEVAVGRTCPFSVRANEDLPSPHLYFARTVKWAQFAVPVDPEEEDPTPTNTRDGATALTDFEGNALYIGGVDNTSLPITQIDRFDTMFGRFEDVADVEPRSSGAAAQLGDGRIVIAGGTASPSGLDTEIDIVDLQAAGDRRVTQEVATSALRGANSPAMVSTSDGHVVTFGGARGLVPLKNIVDIRAVGAGIEQRELQRAELAIARKQHTATRVSDDQGAPILIIGGLDASEQPVARAELYTPLIEEMVPSFMPEMKVPRRDHKAVRLPDGSVLVIGGLDAMGMPVLDLELFTFDSGFQLAGKLPDSAGIIDFSVTPLPDGSILLAGGRDQNNEPVANSFIIRLDPADGDLDIVTTDRLATPRARHQATLLCDGTVMLVGGTLIKAPPERYNPPSTGRR
jgi:hypothetical protein